MFKYEYVLSTSIHMPKVWVQLLPGSVSYRDIHRVGTRDTDLWATPGALRRIYKSSLCGVCPVMVKHPNSLRWDSVLDNSGCEFSDKWGISPVSRHIMYTYQHEFAWPTHITLATVVTVLCTTKIWVHRFRGALYRNRGPRIYFPLSLCGSQQDTTLPPDYRGTQHFRSIHKV